MAIYSWFTHQRWWFSIVMLVYQRVNEYKWCFFMGRSSRNGGISLATFFSKNGWFLGKCSLESSGIPISQAYQDQASIGTATIFETPSSWAFTWNKSLKLNMSDDFCAWEKKKPGFFWMIGWRQSHGLGMGAEPGLGGGQEDPSYSTVDDATPSDLFLDFLTSLMLRSKIFPSTFQHHWCYV